jgi:hypothetical protein
LFLLVALVAFGVWLVRALHGAVRRKPNRPRT